ncbi:hypothetical protein Trydic_g5695 [Trypoxylus dichotomus]
MSGLIRKTIFLLALCPLILAWEALPDIPSGRRSEYYVLNENGEYKYGYDTGNGIAAKQEGDASNEVQGHYFYTGSSGKQIDFKYTAGAQGFIPEGFPVDPQNNIDNSADTTTEPPSENPIPTQANFDDIYVLNPDGSYRFAYATADQSRKEQGDSSGNVEGSYSYKNQAGNHDLSYEAGAEKGFLVTGGSLAVPNGLPAPNSEPTITPIPSQPSFDDIYVLNPDGSYSFAYAAADQSRKEQGDSSGNVEGSYSYKNQAGNHDLSYEAGADKGFLVTGGSLSIPNGLPPPPVPPSPTEVAESHSPWGKTSIHTYLPSNDEKRKFGYILDSKS